MPEQTRIVAPAFPYDRVRLEDGTKVSPPEGWALLKPGDATLTRRVEAAGPTWTVETKKGRRTMSLGIWAPAETIESLRAARAAEVQTPSTCDGSRLAAPGAPGGIAYQGTFRDAILEFLSFAPRHQPLAERLADAVTAHATPVGTAVTKRSIQRAARWRRRSLPTARRRRKSELAPAPLRHED